LASHICSYEVATIVISGNYSLGDLKADLQGM
jgi:hypothetical protein